MREVIHPVPRRCLQTSLSGILTSLTSLFTRTQVLREDTGPGHGEGLSYGARATSHSPAESTLPFPSPNSNSRLAQPDTVLGYHASCRRQSPGHEQRRHVRCHPHEEAFCSRRAGPQTWDGWGAGCSLSPLLFSLFRTLLALFLISVVSCSRSSLVSG